MSYGSFMLQSIGQEQGWSLRSVWENVPTDPASVFVYILLLVGIVWIIRGSWRGKLGKS